MADSTARLDPTDATGSGDGANGPAETRPDDAAVDVAEAPGPAGAPGAAGATTAGGGADLGRRRFFRQFAGELANTAASMVGAAQAIQRTSAELAGAILDPARAVLDDETGAASGDEGAMAGAAFRTSFRIDGLTILFVDQRALPRAIVEHAAVSSAEVTYAIRSGAVVGGPAIGQAAAIGLAFTAERVRATRPYARRATLRGAANALINVSPTHASLGWAVGRVMDAYRTIGELEDDGAAIAEAMRAEADRIVAESTDEHGRLLDVGLAALNTLPGAGEEPLRILVHGPSGTLAGGQCGTALAIAIAAHHGERQVRVIVPEGRHGFTGARISCWELAAAGVPYVLVADAAAPSLIAAGEVDVVLVPADRVAANGDVAAIIGTYPIAAAASSHGVPVFVCAPLSAIDAATPAGSAMTIGSRPDGELDRFGDTMLAPRGTEVRGPAHDVTPVELVTAFVTGDGLRHAPFGGGDA